VEILMAHRRLAITALAVALALAGPACRFSRSDKDASASSTTASTLVTLGEETATSLGDETTTTVDPLATTTTARNLTTTSRRTTVTTRAVVRTATTARPVSSPHCSASAGNTVVGSPWTVSVSSTFPNSEVVIDLSFAGGSGNYSGVTDPGGSWSKTQPRASQAMKGTVQVTVTVASRVKCYTSFTVS
jgi:hypothetical protein